MPTIRADYQNAEWSILLSALEKPERFFELRQEFPRSAFRDETSRAIFRACMILLEAPDGLALLKKEIPLLSALEDALGRASPVYQVACDVLLGSRAGLREDHEWESWKGRLRELICRHEQAVLEDKLKRAETTNEIQALAAQLTALQGRGKSSLTESATVDVAKYAAISSEDAPKLLPRSLWSGIQREGTLTIVAAAPKAGKSWFILSKIQHAILGKPFLGRDMLAPSSGNPRKALLMDFELPEKALMHRYVRLAGPTGAFEEHHKSKLFDPTRILIESHRKNMAQRVAWVDYCCERIISFCEPGDIAVIDCLQPIMGDQDANLAQVVRPIFGKFQAAAEQSGAAVELVDHFNKSTEGTGKNRISGSMAKSAGPDSIITLNSHGTGTTVELDLRMDPPIDKFHIEFKPFEFVVISEEQLEERKQAGKRSKREETLLETFPNGIWHTVKNVADHLGIGKGGAQKRIDNLKDDYLEEKREGQTKYYRRIDNSTPKQ